jgi:3',5'-cyclic AMP phosphodiesterase CpdA
MRLHVLSDLHLEHAPFKPPQSDADAVILAGDIATGTAGVEWATREFPADRPVLYLAGNHEFYGHKLPGLIEELKTAAAGSHVHVLEDDQVFLGDVRFLGCTLWSDFDFAGADNRADSMLIAARVVNDYKAIRSSTTNLALAPEETRAIHERSRAWLADRLATSHDGPTVVITHHVPIIERRPTSPILQAIGGSFASDLAELIESTAPKLWVYGHNHRQADLRVGATRLLSNPRGYPREPVAAFDPGLVVEV